MWEDWKRKKRLEKLGRKCTWIEFNSRGVQLSLQRTRLFSCGRFRCQFCVKGLALGWLSLSPFGPLQPWHGAASWERLSDPLQRRAGRFTGRRAERSANNKDGQRAEIPFIPSTDRSPLLGRIKKKWATVAPLRLYCTPVTHVAKQAGILTKGLCWSATNFSILINIKKKR